MQLILGDYRMGLEFLGLILSFAFLAFLTFFVGRLLALLIKTVLVAGLLYLLILAYQNQAPRICEARSIHSQQTILSGLFCQP